MKYLILYTYYIYTILLFFYNCVLRQIWSCPGVPNYANDPLIKKAFNCGNTYGRRALHKNNNSGGDQ